MPELPPLLLPPFPLELVLAPCGDSCGAEGAGAEKWAGSERMGSGWGVDPIGPELKPRARGSSVGDAMGPGMGMTGAEWGMGPGEGTTGEE